MAIRYHTDKDKKIAYEIIRRKSCNKPVCEIGRSVLYMPPDNPNADDNKSEGRLREGSWLGTN